MTAAPIASVAAIVGSMAPTDVSGLSTMSTAVPRSSFGNLLTESLQNVEAKLDHADQLARAFIVDDSIPVHQVTYALEQARLSMELMVQVRNHLVEGYQQLLTMQL